MKPQNFKFLLNGILIGYSICGISLFFAFYKVLPNWVLTGGVFFLVCGIAFTLYDCKKEK